MNIKIVTAILAMSIAVSSCSSKPEIGDVEQNLQNQITQESEGRIELISIEKTNSVDREFMGQEVHTIEFKAKLKFLKDCYMYVNKSGYGPYIQSFKTYSEVPEFVPSLEMQGVKCKKGVEIDYTGSSTFSNTENGWVQSN